MEQSINQNSVARDLNDRQDDSASDSFQTSRQERLSQTSTTALSTDVSPALPELTNQKDVTVKLKTFNLPTSELKKALNENNFISHDVPISNLKCDG